MLVCKQLLGKEAQGGSAHSQPAWPVKQPQFIAGSLLPASTLSLKSHLKMHSC